MIFFILPMFKNIYLRILLDCLYNFIHIFVYCSVASNSVAAWTIARHAPLFMEFPRPFPPPGDLPNPRIKPMSLTSPALAGGFFTTSATCITKLIQFSVSATSGQWCFQGNFLKSNPFLKVYMSCHVMSMYDKNHYNTVK